MILSAHASGPTVGTLVGMEVGVLVGTDGGTIVGIDVGMLVGIDGTGSGRRSSGKLSKESNVTYVEFLLLMGSMVG